MPERGGWPRRLLGGIVGVALVLGAALLGAVAGRQLVAAALPDLEELGATVDQLVPTGAELVASSDLRGTGVGNLAVWLPPLPDTAERVLGGVDADAIVASLEDGGWSRIDRAGRSPRLVRGTTEIEVADVLGPGPERVALRARQHQPWWAIAMPSATGLLAGGTCAWLLRRGR